MRKKGIWLFLLFLFLRAGGAHAEPPDGPDLSRLDLSYIRNHALVINALCPTPSGIVARYTGVDLGGEGAKNKLHRAVFRGRRRGADQRPNGGLVR